MAQGEMELFTPQTLPFKGMNNADRKWAAEMRRRRAMTTPNLPTETAWTGTPQGQFASPMGQGQMPMTTQGRLWLGNTYPDGITPSVNPQVAQAPVTAASTPISRAMGAAGPAVQPVPRNVAPGAGAMFAPTPAATGGAGAAGNAMLAAAMGGGTPLPSPTGPNISDLAWYNRPMANARAAGPLLPGGIKGLGSAAMRYGGAGLMAKSAVDALGPQSGTAGDVGDFLGNAAMGAGLGATAGTLGGPFAGLTVPAGALIGAGGGLAYTGLQKLFGGGDDEKPDPLQQIRDAETQVFSSLDMTFDPTTASSLKASYNLRANTPAFNADGSAVDPVAIKANAINQLVADADSVRQQQASAQMQAQQFAAMQYGIDEIMRPINQQMVSGAQAQADMLTQIAPQFPSYLRPLIEYNAANVVGNANQTAASYASAAQAAPAIYNLNQIMQMYSQMPRQQAPTTADFSSLIAGATGAGAWG